MTLPAFMNPTAEVPPAPVGPDLAERFPGGGRAPTGPIRGFPFTQQALPNWCWAAVSAGVDAVRGGRRSQCQIAQLYGGYSGSMQVRAVLQPPCCPPRAQLDTIGYLNEVLDMLDLSNGNYVDIDHGDGTATAARTDLAASRPLPVRIAWSQRNGDGHFISLVGLSDQVDSFLVYDPSETHEDVGHLLTVSEGTLAGGYDGQGSWSHRYPVK